MLHLECCSLGKTRRVRGVFQPSLALSEAEVLMCRRMKVKPNAFRGIRNSALSIDTIPNFNEVEPYGEAE
ncbi:hypothetical protein IQ257_22290 [Coleofasciculus sp. LEGE 07092]|nr:MULTISPECIES: hypothetical protein [unclassified Coleofasciculus]MBE9125974.1 hypothetical protein [Coleofasciculus sp. LEGE 07081]MBE9151168.1 hypothetical protein [Coleofasciculus sp. LEGE 07092]